MTFVIVAASYLPTRTVPVVQMSSRRPHQGSQPELVEDSNAEAPPAYTPTADVGESTLEVDSVGQPLTPLPRRLSHSSLQESASENDQRQRHTGLSPSTTNTDDYVPPLPLRPTHSQNSSFRSDFQSTLSTSMHYTDPLHVSDLSRDSYTRDRSEHVDSDIDLDSSPSSVSRSSSSSSSISSYHSGSRLRSSRSTPTTVAAHRTSPPAMSDFARDFYANGARGQPLVTRPTPGLSNTRLHARSVANANARQPGPSPPTSNQNLNRHASPPRSHYGESSNNLGRGTRSAVQDDGRPTREPRLGHPLLLNERILVYPSGHECHKCECWIFLFYERATIGSRRRWCSRRCGLW